MKRLRQIKCHLSYKISAILDIILCDKFELITINKDNTGREESRTTTKYDKDEINENIK